MSLGRKYFNDGRKGAAAKCQSIVDQMTINETPLAQINDNGNGKKKVTSSIR